MISTDGTVGSTRSVKNIYNNFQTLERRNLPVLTIAAIPADTAVENAGFFGKPFTDHYNWPCNEHCLYFELKKLLN